MKVGDSVEILRDGQRKIGVIQDVSHDVVTVLVAGGEGHASVMVKPERLKSAGPQRWRIDR